MEEKKMKVGDKILDRVLDIFFSKDKTKLFVLIFFALAFILRLIAVINLPTSVDASGHAVMAFNFISSGKLGVWNQSVGLWHFLTDLTYKIFGVGNFGAKFIQLLFGSLSVIVMFLFTKEVFNKKVGLIAAFLLAICPFHIVETIPEMDVTTLFFALLAMLFFVKALKGDKKLFFVLSGAFVGIATLIKLYSLFFIPALILYAVYHTIKYKTNRKKFIKGIIIFSSIAFVFVLILLSYNYLLYKDKGYVDYNFSSILGLGNEKSDQYYSWIAPYNHEYKAFILGGSEELPGKLPVFIYQLGHLRRSDTIMYLFGLLGIIFALKRKNKDYLFMFLFIMLTLFFYLGSISVLMTKHFLFEVIVFAPFAALSLSKITEKIKIKHILIILLILILIFQLFWLHHYTNGQFYNRSSMNELIKYKKNIAENALVVWDSRIFRGMGTFFFMDKHYIETNYLSALITTQEQLPSQYGSQETYFIECVSDDCGWGTVAEQPEFNQSMEGIVDFFKNNSILVKSIEGSGGLSYSYNIYKTSLQLKEGILQIADTTHIFWANPVGYDETITPIFDNYETHNALDGFINIIAHLIFYSAFILSIISIFIVFYLLIKEQKKVIVENDEKKNETLNYNSGL